MENRPRGRETHITGQGKDIYKRGEGLGTGPVGKTGGYQGRPGTTGSGSSSGGQTQRAGGGRSPLLLIVILAVVLLGGGGAGLSSLLGGGGSGVSDYTEPSQSYTAPSYTTQTPSATLKPGSASSGSTSSSMTVPSAREANTASTTYRFVTFCSKSPHASLRFFSV